MWLYDLQTQKISTNDQSTCIIWTAISTWINTFSDFKREKSILMDGLEEHVKSFMNSILNELCQKYHNWRENCQYIPEKDDQNFEFIDDVEFVNKSTLWKSVRYKIADLNCIKEKNVLLTLSNPNNRAQRCENEFSLRNHEILIFCLHSNGPNHLLHLQRMK